MAHGYAHIFALPGAATNSETRIPTYQFTFNDGGNAYARVFDEGELVEFLSDDMGLRADVVDGAFKELHDAGKAIIGDLELNETEAAEMGLVEVPTD